MRVLAFGTYDVSRHPRIGVLIAGLRAHGAIVEEVVKPLRFNTAERVRMLQQPWRLPVLAGHLVSCWVGILAGGLRAARRVPIDAVLVGYLGHFDVVLARMAFPRTPVVLDHLLFAGDTARDRGTAGMRGLALDALDGLALRCADVIVLDTEDHAALVPPRRRGDVVICPVGADWTWFDAANAASGPAEGDPLRVIFFGLHTPLQGTAHHRPGGRGAGQTVGTSGSRWSAPVRTTREPDRLEQPTRTSPGRNGYRPRSYPRWSPATTSASASSAPAPRPAEWCRTRRTKERRLAASSSPATHDLSAALWSPWVSS